MRATSQHRLRQYLPATRLTHAAWADQSTTARSVMISRNSKSASIDATCKKCDVNANPIQVLTRRKYAVNYRKRELLIAQRLLHGQHKMVDGSRCDLLQHVVTGLNMQTHPPGRPIKQRAVTGRYCRWANSLNTPNRLFCLRAPCFCRGTVFAGGWPVYGGDDGGQHHAALAQINRSNVAQLELAWSYRHGELENFTGPRMMASWHVTPILLPPRCRPVAGDMHAFQSGYRTRSCQWPGALGV